MTEAQNPPKNEKRQKQVYDPNKPLNFIISIDEAEWESIKPIETTWADRNTLKFQPGWTDLILDKIWQQYPLECPFSMHNHKFCKRQGFAFLKFDGNCNECGATIIGQIFEKPTSFPYTVNIDTFDTREIQHTKSRQLRYSKREKFREKAKNDKPLKLRHLQANDNLDDQGNLNFNSKVRPDLNSTAAISKLRHENKKEDAAAYPGDVVSEIINFKLDHPKYIRSFSTVPVVIRYWSENQLNFWNEVAPLGFYISIDASGRFTLPLTIVENQKSPPIFFYNIVVKIARKIYTLAQMLSSAHDVGEIASWLSAWIKSGATIPLGAVVDCALALLNSLCMIFNHCTFIQHLDKNMNVLLGRSHILPVCKIKRDKAHLIKASSVWSCFTGDNWVKKDLYLRIIAYSLEIKVLAEIKEVVIALFVVCQSKHQSSQYRESYNTLQNKISTFDHKKFYNVQKEDRQECNYESCEILRETDCSGKQSIEDGVMSDCSAKGFILELKLKADNLLKADKAKDSSIPNSYHLPDICSNLLQLYTQFSIWTNVMDPFYTFDPYKVSTSTGSEIYYKITRIDYGFSAPMSLKLFLLAQKPIIDGATKLGRRFLKLFLEKLADEEKKDQMKNDVGSIVPLAPRKTFQEVMSDVVKAMNGCGDSFKNDQHGTVQYKTNAKSIQCAISKENQIERTNIEQRSTDVVFRKNIERVAEPTSELDDTAKTRIEILCINLDKYLITMKDYYFRIPYIDLEKCTFSVEEFQSLKVPNFVNGNVIDVFMNIKIQTEWKDIAVIPTSQSVFMVGDQWEGSHGSDWEMYRFQCDDNPKFIFIPYCFGRHWCLIILDLLKETALHLDPLYLEPLERHDYKKALKHYLLNCDDTNVLKYKNWTWIENNVQLYRQLDGHSCGPIVMHYMTVFANLNTYSYSQSQKAFNPNEFRFEICNLLLEWADANDDICLYCFNVDRDHYQSGFTQCKSCNRWAHDYCAKRSKTKLDLGSGKCEFCQPFQYQCFYCNNIDKMYCDYGFSSCKTCPRWAHNYCINNNTMFDKGKCEFCQSPKKS